MPTKEELLDPKSEVHKENPLWLRPGETPETYKERTKTKIPVETKNTPMDEAEGEMPPVFEDKPPADETPLKERVEKQRQMLEEQYKSQPEQTKEDMEKQRKIKEKAEEEQKGVLGKFKKEAEPFREDIEKTERRRLKVEENYFANQQLVNEMDELLTESIELTRQLQEQKVPGLAGIQQSDRMKRTKEKVQSRISVIRAVMSARNNQIGTALGFIDRTKSDIQQDRQGRIDYLNTLFNFYENTKNEAGQKIFNLDEEQKETINSQIDLIKNEMERTERVSDIVKEMMLQNPQMAAEAGITLSDTEEEISQKLADWEYTEEVRSLKNELETEGITELTEAQAKMKTEDQIFTYTDSRGVERKFLLPTDEGEWQLRTIDRDLYRVNPKTGKKELLVGGGEGAPGGGDEGEWENPETGEIHTDREYAEVIAKDNIDKSEDAIVNEIRSTIVDEKGKSLISVGDAQRIAKVAKEEQPELTDEEYKQSAKEFLEYYQPNDREAAEAMLRAEIGKEYTETGDDGNYLVPLPSPEQEALDEMFSEPSKWYKPWTWGK